MFSHKREPFAQAQRMTVRGDEGDALPHAALGAEPAEV